MPNRPVPLTLPRPAPLRPARPAAVHRPASPRRWYIRVLDLTRVKNKNASA